MFEDALNKGLFQEQAEKTYIDKILSRQDVEAIREIIRKPRLKREDLLEVLYLISGTESKLLNYGEWDRYVILKFFVWIREFVKIAELLYDYQDDLERKENLCKCGGYQQSENLPVGALICTCDKFKQKFFLSSRTKRLLDNNERLIEHNAKFLIDLYLNIGRTSLSIGATGILELLKNKYEMTYPGQQLATPQKEPLVKVAWKK